LPAIAKPDDESEAIQQVVLISDLQKGASDAALRSYEWPKSVKLDVRTVASSKPTNATLSLLGSRAKSGDDAQRDDRLRIRVTNSDDATDAQFRLAWVGREGNVFGAREYPLHVPPGTSQVVRVDRPAAGIDQLSLIGDDHSFDNDLYIADPPRVDRQLLYVGNDLGEDRDSLLFFLRKAPLSNRWQNVEATRCAPDAPLPPLDPKQTPLVVVGSPLPEVSVGPLVRFCEVGGRLLVVLAQPSEDVEPWQQFLRSISGNDRLTIGEAAVRDYALLSNIDFRHPLFQPLADPQFSDFTGIRFWSHRNVDLGEQTQMHTIANFDDRWPALIEQRHEQGRLWILTAGWQPQQSRLALSSKFLPLLGKMFDTTGGRPVYALEYYVNDVFTIEPSDTLTQLRHPDGNIETIAATGDAVTLDQVGVYQIMQDALITPVAVNIPPAEGETAPRSIDDLEQLGVAVGKLTSGDVLAARQRQMQDVDLEQRQKIWKWLLLAVLGVLAVEIAVAHRQTVRTSTTTLQPSSPAA